MTLAVISMKNIAKTISVTTSQYVSQLAGNKRIRTSSRKRAIKVSKEMNTPHPKLSRNTLQERLILFFCRAVTLLKLKISTLALGALTVSQEENFLELGNLVFEIVFLLPRTFSKLSNLWRCSRVPDHLFLGLFGISTLLINRFFLPSTSSKFIWKGGFSERGYKTSWFWESSGRSCIDVFWLRKSLRLFISSIMSSLGPIQIALLPVVVLSEDRLLVTFKGYLYFLSSLFRKESSIFLASSWLSLFIPRLRPLKI